MNSRAWRQIVIFGTVSFTSLKTAITSPSTRYPAIPAGSSSISSVHARTEREGIWP